jgi:hypothetical protein
MELILSDEIFGRLTVGARWNGVVGAFEKLQKQANGGCVHGWGTEEGEIGSAQDRRRRDS